MWSLIRRYAEFRGRSGRAEFWRWVLLMVVFWSAAGWIEARSGLVPRSSGPHALQLGGPLSGVFVLLTIPPSWAVAVRRLHDVGWRGWWLLLPPGLGAVGVVMLLIMALLGSGGLVAAGIVVILSPLAGLLFLLLLFVRRGMHGPNRFGPDPADPAGALDLREVFR